MDVLERITQLRGALKPDATIKQAEAWWDQYALIESDLDFDPRTSKHERSVLDRLKDSLSHATLAIREGARFPDLSRIHMALSALEDSIQRRTIGPDGWPLKR